MVLHALSGGVKVRVWLCFVQPSLCDSKSVSEDAFAVATFQICHGRVGGVDFWDVINVHKP